MAATSDREAVREFIAKKLAKSREQALVADSENIIETGLLDSLGVMQLVPFIEETFSVTVKDEDIVPENFESVDAISAYIEKAKQG